MQDRQQSKIPVLNFILFVSLSFAVLLGHALLMSYLNPQDAKAPQELAAGKVDEQKADEQKAHDDQPKLPDTVAPVEQEQEKPDDSVPGDQVAAPDGVPAAEQAAKPAEPEGQWVMLGSADPAAPYRMLVTLTNRGAAVSRIELNSPRYLDLEDRSGYLGHLVVDEELADKQAGGRGCYVQVVGQGTPAAEADVEQGDVIVAVDNAKINTASELWYEMQQTKPKQQVALKILRDGQELTLTATLRRRPLDVVKPDENDPLSMLLSFRQIGDEELPDPHTKMKDAERRKDEDDEKLQLARAGVYRRGTAGPESARRQLGDCRSRPNPCDLSSRGGEVWLGRVENLPLGENSRRRTGRPQLQGLSPGVRGRNRKCRPREPEIRLSTRWPHGIANRRLVVRQQNWAYRILRRCGRAARRGRPERGQPVQPNWLSHYRQRRIRRPPARINGSITSVSTPNTSRRLSFPRKRIQTNFGLPNGNRFAWDDSTQNW